LLVAGAFGALLLGVFPNRARGGVTNRDTAFCEGVANLVGTGVIFGVAGGGARNNETLVVVRDVWCGCYEGKPKQLVKRFEK
jgi:hypothetical protein